MTGGPGTAIALEKMWRETDVRDVLPAVHVPTLVRGRAGPEDLQGRASPWLTSTTGP
jgi:hypothetical protein